MNFRLIIDETQPEEVVATVHQRSSLTDQLEALVLSQVSADWLMAYREDDTVLLRYSEIECITVVDRKTYAIDRQNRQYRLRQRLYELEAGLPSTFIRINKSTIANENRLERFVTGFSGAVDAVFKCGYREYVSRRCFAAIKRRYQQK